MRKTRERFEITREDGRSNTQVICDLVGKCAPGRVFSYEEIRQALEEGASHEYKLSNVQGAVRSAGPKLGRLHKRALHNVRLTGYRLALAQEHRSLAVDRQSKASRQLKRGFEILRDTRLDEIKDEQSRRAHEGQLLVISALLHAAAAQERRIGRVEQIINNMISEAIAVEA
jgi:hypothetical protein